MVREGKVKEGEGREGKGREWNLSGRKLKEWKGRGQRFFPCSFGRLFVQCFYGIFT